MNRKVFQFLSSVVTVSLSIVPVFFALAIAAVGVVVAFFVELYLRFNDWLHQPVLRREIDFSKSWKQLVTNLSSFF